jgi:NADH-quinone oxidoreductase subunit G
MCLVEVKGGPPKPTASCAMNVRDLRPGPNGEPPEMATNSPMVKKAREGVMEFLLINHPLDCPICDQGGECDLQDQAMAFGVDNSRYGENKRAVEDKYIGPLVKTIMTRCIHCTRCVRFTTEVAGISDMGLIGRGEDAEITTYLESALSSELQGNVIDLCPVGALTSRPYEFHARPWELNKTESIDVMDGLGASIRVDSRGKEVMRVMPRLNEETNEEWISDKSRFIWDGLRTQRLDKPYVRVNGKLRAATWDEAFGLIASNVKGSKPNKVGAIAGDLSSVEEMFAFKDLLEKLGSPNMDCRPAGSCLDPNLGTSTYLFNSTVAGIENADALMLIGCDPRKESAVLNSRIRKRWLMGDFPIARIGPVSDLTYDVLDLGSTPAAIAQFVAHGPAKVEKPMFIIGEGVTTRPDGAAIMADLTRAAASLGVIKDGWNGFNILHNAAARVGGLAAGFVPGSKGLATADMLKKLDVLFLLGADELDLRENKAKFTVYIGTHGDVGAHHADVILPGAAYTEKSATYVNTEGRVQMTNRAIFPPGDARDDWAIIRALSAHLDAVLPYDSLPQLRRAMYETHPEMAAIDECLSTNSFDVSKLAERSGELSDQPFTSPIDDFYLTNPIARASKVMAECSQLRHDQQQIAAE